MVRCEVINLKAWRQALTTTVCDRQLADCRSCEAQTRLLINSWQCLTCLLVFVLSSISTSTNATEFSATKLDGTTIAGNIKDWNEQQISLITSDGEQHVPISQLLSLIRSDRPAHVAKESLSRYVELVDGSIIPMDDLQSTGVATTAFVNASKVFAGAKIVLERKQLAVARLQSLDATVADQWQEIQELDSAGDVLVIKKRGGKSLDHVEGALGDIGQDKIEFKLEDELVRIDRGIVAGIIYHRRSTADLPEPRCVLHGQTGLKAKAVRAQLVGDVIRLSTPAGVELSWPLEDIHWVDFSAGKLLYLSEMEPVTEQWTPLVALPSGAELANSFGKPRRDRSAFGGPLTLLAADGHAFSESQLRQFSKGLALRSRTELSYRLPTGFRRFLAEAGIDPATSTNGQVRLEIYGDERELLGIDIAGHELQSIEVDIAGVKRLKIIVDYGQNFDTGDWLNLCNARIVK